MGRYLASSERFRRHAMGDAVARDCHIHESVTEGVTVAGLVRVWGVTKRDGVADGDDIRLACADLETLDRITGYPDFGKAMASVHWVEVVDGGQLVFPKLLLQLRSTGERRRACATERKRRQRMRDRAAATASSAEDDPEADCLEAAAREQSRVTERDIGVTPPVTGPLSDFRLLDPVPVPDPVTGEEDLYRSGSSQKHGVQAEHAGPDAGPVNPNSPNRKPAVRKPPADGQRLSLEQCAGIAELRELTGERDGDGFYHAIVTRLPMVGVQRVISELRDAIRDPGARVRRPGALAATIATRVGAEYGVQVFHQRTAAA